jgi:hypothetical protein
MKINSGNIVTQGCEENRKIRTDTYFIKRKIDKKNISFEKYEFQMNSGRMEEIYRGA